VIIFGVPAASQKLNLYATVRTKILTLSPSNSQQLKKRPIVFAAVKKPKTHLFAMEAIIKSKIYA